MKPPGPPRVVVTAAVVERDGRFLVTRRPRGTHLEGCWEFPGGKCDTDEGLETCLCREIVEELDSQVRVDEEIYSVSHTYPERVVELHFFRCELLGEPRPLLGQEMQWVPREHLTSLEFPPADAGLIQLLISGAGGTENTEGRSPQR
jgi:8-oxo-dGTP diphosphatase